MFLASHRTGTWIWRSGVRKDWRLIEPLWMLKYLPNMLACHVSILHNAQGPNNSITESDVSSLLALGEAHRILLREQADFMLVGGAESKINPLGWSSNCLFGRCRKRNDAPEKASRPFDSDRDGVVFGEGGGVIVAEDLEHARKRGARIYAELAGFGSAFDRSTRWPWHGPRHPTCAEPSWAHG